MHFLQGWKYGSESGLSDFFLGFYFIRNTLTSWFIVAYWRISYWNHLKFYKQISIVVKTISMFYCPCRHYNRIIAIIALENVRFTKYFDICGLLSFDLMLLLISCISILCFACEALGELYMYQYKYVCL